MSLNKDYKVYFFVVIAEVGLATGKTPDLLCVKLLGANLIINVCEICTIKKVGPPCVRILVLRS